jgi:CubicO group peptidase (beta-lactamase class C family)
MTGAGEVARLAAEVQRENRLPSVVVAAARDGAPLGASAIGAADVDGDATVGTAYRIGSITKTFTAALVLRLVERGELELDAPVRSYLSDTSFGQVPLRSLLSHCGGLQREVPVDMWTSMRGPNDTQLHTALRDVAMVDQPGVRWHYSNLGYAVLGQVVAHATGTKCVELIDSELLTPLSLTATSWTRPENAAVGYRLDPYADALHPEPEMDQAAIGVAGQLWSTCDDLLVWGDALAGGAPEVLSAHVVTAMHTVHTMVDQRSWTSGWGLGLILDRRGDRILAGHTGTMPGFRAALCLDRDTRTIAVVLTNATRGGNIGSLAADIVELDLDTTGPVAQGPWRPAQPIPDELDGVLGRWWSEADESVFSWRADGLHACLAATPNTSDTRFTREGADAYRAVKGRLTGERLQVHRDEGGQVTRLEWATYPFTRSPR